MAFHPYLMFGGDCREAFTRYREIFGGELFLLPMTDMPTDEKIPADTAHMILHAALRIGDDLLMASDDPTVDKVGPVQGIHVNYTVAEPAEAERIFDALADGGHITGAIGPTFFSPMFGMCTDRFGVPWMISADAPVEADAAARQ